ncbi:MAG: HIT family protein [Patescibacteria group bacterium]
MSDGCIFCKVISNELPRQAVYENDNVLVFLNIKPLSLGHSLVVPKKHFKDLQNIPQGEYKEVMDTIKKVALPLSKAAGAGSYNLVLNNDEIAGQSIPHLHWHIIPRSKDDGLFDWEQFGGRDYEDGEWELFGEKIRNSLERL